MAFPNQKFQPERVPGTSQARAHLREGHPELALQLARENAQADDGGAWRWIEIDALRAMRRHRDAAERLAALAPTLPPAERPAAGFLLANLRLDRLHDPQGALTALHELGCDEDPALRQRSLALRVHALAEAGRPDEARDAALHYLERYPTGEHRAQMQRFADRR